MTFSWNYPFDKSIKRRYTHIDPLNEGTVPGNSLSVIFWLQLLLKVQAYDCKNVRVPAEGIALAS